MVQIGKGQYQTNLVEQPTLNNVILAIKMQIEIRSVRDNQTQESFLFDGIKRCILIFSASSQNEQIWDNGLVMWNNEIQI